MRDPFLSICIPTFNRYSYLKNLLDNILSIDSNILERLDICISNNASNDDTHKLVEDYSNKIEINYFCQNKNIGSNMNILHVASMASSKHILIMGDDDILEEKNLTKIFNLIKSKPKNIHIFNNSKIKKLREGDLSKFTFFKYLVFHSFNSLGFIGHYVFPADVFKNFLKDDYLIDRWPHLGLLTHAINTNHEISFYPLELVSQAPNPVLSWTKFGWAEVKFKQVKVIYNGLANKKYSFLRVIIAMRMIFDKSLFKTIILWKLQSNNFNKEFKAIIDDMHLSGSIGRTVIVNIIKIYRLFFLLFPKSIISSLFYLFGMESKLKRLKIISDNKNDGISRG